ncbi:helix-turn-helix transcriptional regulator [bacterium]|jgi:transcriptional regulator with XRE-family HTH domain|nr:helix-turn-helix transcriptional regulator [bacterium]MBT3729909.1 helix-turn-helix transcriptional regulator [bacterium]MBT4894875.1 helix-turn-helix transcriptional regulator [bacterium]
MSKNKSGINKTIRGYRQERGMSQEALARAADLSFPTIVKIESGDTPNPTIDTVKKIADALDVSVDKLLK